MQLWCIQGFVVDQLVLSGFRLIAIGVAISLFYAPFIQFILIPMELKIAKINERTYIPKQNQTMKD